MNQENGLSDNRKQFWKFQISFNVCKDNSQICIGKSDSFGSSLQFGKSSTKKFTTKLCWQFKDKND